MDHLHAYETRTEIARAMPHAAVTIVWDGPRSYVVTIREAAADHPIEIWTPQQAARFLERRRVPA